MDKKIDQIIHKALDGGEINEGELLSLLSVQPMSEESFMIRYASRKMSEAASGGKAETTFIANTDDFDEEGARALKEAGFHGIYHVVHMGEGTITAIHPRTRLKTIAAA